MTVFRAANVLMALLFLIAAGLQYNDPDPELWAPLYLGAAAACLVPRRPALWPLAAVVTGVALLWAAWLAPAVLPGFAVGDLFRSMKAESPRIEESREFLGLLIVAAWMLTVIAVTRRRPA